VRKEYGWREDFVCGQNKSNGGRSVAVSVGCDEVGGGAKGTGQWRGSLSLITVREEGPWESSADRFQSVSCLKLCTHSLHEEW
jgi:hypothetical protein